MINGFSCRHKSRPRSGGGVGMWSADRAHEADTILCSESLELQSFFWFVIHSAKSLQYFEGRLLSERYRTKPLYIADCAL